MASHKVELSKYDETELLKKVGKNKGTRASAGCLDGGYNTLLGEPRCMYQQDLARLHKAETRSHWLHNNILIFG